MKKEKASSTKKNVFRVSYVNLEDGVEDIPVEMDEDASDNDNEKAKKEN